MQKTIAILYKNSDFISKDKMKIKDYLTEDMNKKLINPLNKTVYETDDVRIYWVDSRTRNLNKLFRNNNIDVVISAENEEYWKIKKYQRETLFDKIKEEIDSTFEKITIYKIVHNWEVDKPQYKIIEEQCFDCQVRRIGGTWHKNKEDALIELYKKIEEDNKLKQINIEYLEQRIKENLRQIEINNKFIEEYEGLLED